MFLALREIRFAKGRFALMGGVIALLTLLLIMLSGLTSGLAEQSISALDTLGQNKDRHTPAIDTIVFDAPANHTRTVSFDSSSIVTHQFDQWKSNADTAHVEPLGIAPTRFQHLAEAKDSIQATVPGTIFGVPGEGELAPVPLHDRSIALGKKTAQDLGVALQDTVEANGVRLTVEAIVDDRWYSHMNVSWTTNATWKTLAHVSDPEQIGTVLAVRHRTAKPNNDSLNSSAHTRSLSRTDAFQALSSFTSEQGSLLLIQAFLYGISALVVAAFLSVWTVQRTRDIAVIKALGGSNGYVLRDCLVQASLILLGGALLGSGVGLLVGIEATAVAPFALNASTTLLPAVGIFLIGLFASTASVFRVTKVDPLVALGGN